MELSLQKFTIYRNGIKFTEVSGTSKEDRGILLTKAFNVFKTKARTVH
jgi:hypothetical protein